MNVPRLILEEAIYRKTQSLLIVLAVVVATALPVAFFTTGKAAARETTRVMRNLGYNLRIVPRDTDMVTYWTDGFAHGRLPEDAVQRFAQRGDLSYNHLLALLVERVELSGEDVLLTGISGEVSPATKQGSSMIFEVAPNELHLGYEVARRLGLEPGATLDWKGREFTVAANLSQTGTLDDVRVWSSLRDAQALLGESGQVNEIQALECYCALPGVDNLALLREQLSEVVPEGEVLRMEAMAEAREQQRRLSEDFLGLVMPWVVLGGGIGIALLIAINVRERRKEIGVLRALGHGSGSIALLFVGKAASLGVLGAILGFALGEWMAIDLAPEIFPETGGGIVVEPFVFCWALLGAPLLAVLASLPPVLLAVSTDPALCLSELGDA